MPGTAIESSAPSGGTVGGLRAPRLVVPLPPATAAQPASGCALHTGKPLALPTLTAQGISGAAPGSSAQETLSDLESTPQATGGGVGKGGWPSYGHHSHKGNKPGPLTPRHSDLFWRVNRPTRQNTGSWLTPSTHPHLHPQSRNPHFLFSLGALARETQLPRAASRKCLSLRQRFLARAPQESLKHATPDYRVLRLSN